MDMNLGALNYLAIVLAALSLFVVGGLWYSLLFAKAWMKAADMTPEKASGGRVVMRFAGTFLLGVFAAFILALFIGIKHGTVFGLIAGFLVGFGWIAPMLGIYYLFERRSLVHFAINASYAVVAFSLMGVIIGAMQ